jgi:lipid II:glycine glycyltransferase (peptidoglycan interpeptide bridge formation enzyme)
MNQTTKQHIEFLNDRIGDGGFLQSQEWRNFQECTGKRTFHFESEGGYASVMEHTLPWAGKYWYIPRGPIIDQSDFLQSIIDKARQENIGWIRIEPTDEDGLCAWNELSEVSVEKTARDTQPKEILVMRINENEEALLAQMKSKTRYNIRLAEKKSVKVFTSRKQTHIDAFCDLVAVTAKRDGITAHPRAYYQKILQVIPDTVLKLYLAEHDGNIIAANLVVFFGEYATYLHGASGNDSREVMAPYLLQWRQIQDAKKNGCEYYDFGGVNTGNKSHKWTGITRFKQGFAPQRETTYFLGSYDIILAKNKYTAYLIVQGLKTVCTKIRTCLR